MVIVFLNPLLHSWSNSLQDFSVVALLADTQLLLVQTECASVLHNIILYNIS